MPAAFAYLSLPPSLHAAAGPDVAEVVAAVGRELEGVAAGAGYELAGVFTDVRGRTETGLYAMLTALRRGRAVAVVVPDLGHLRHAGCLAGADPRTASRYLRARLLPLNPDPGQCPDAAATGGGQDPVMAGPAVPVAGPTRPWWSLLAPGDPTGTGADAGVGPRRARGAHR